MHCTAQRARIVIQNFWACNVIDIFQIMVWAIRGLAWTQLESIPLQNPQKSLSESFFNNGIVRRLLVLGAFMIRSEFRTRVNTVLQSEKGERENKTMLCLQYAAFFQPICGNERNWIFRNLEFSEKILEFSEKILQFREKIA